MYGFKQHPVRAPALLAMTVLAGLFALFAATRGDAAIVSVSANTSIQSLPQDTHGQTITFDRTATGNETIQSAFTSASSSGDADTDGSFNSVARASAAAGSLHVAADTIGYTRAVNPVSDAGGHASASWADTFIVTATGHDAGEVLSYHGRLGVEGRLADSILYRSYAQSTAVATLRIDPSTGFNSGLVFLDHVADLATGYDTGVRKTGERTLTFDFTFPFTLGRNVTVSAALDVFTFVRSLGGGDLYWEARSTADYGRTMRWLGGEAFDAGAIC